MQLLKINIILIMRVKIVFSHYLQKEKKKITQIQNKFEPIYIPFVNMYVILWSVSFLN